jgi:hypothetical protein
MCGTCGCKSAESFEATEWVGFCPECNKWRTKDMSVKIDSKINTTGWSIPDKLLGKRLCKKSQRFGNIRQSGDTFTGYGSRPFDDSYCGTPLTKVKSKYKTEGFEAETKLSKTSCCCGADEANPCACMKAPEPMECSAKAPKCACYKALEKNAESFEAEGILCSDCPMAGRHVVIRKDHTDEDGNLICPFCHSNKNFKNIPETTYLLHGGRREDLNAETFEARDNSWCVNHGWIRGGTKVGDIIPCLNCNDMICDGCRCGGCGNCNTSDCCECSHNQAAESEDCEVCYTTVDKGTLNDVQAGRICNECHNMNQYDGGTRTIKTPYNAESFEAEFLYYYILNEKGESPADFDTLEEAQAYVANSSEPLEIYERRNRDDEAYKMDKKMNAESFNAYSRESRIQNLIDNLYDDREIALNKLLKIKNASLQKLLSKNALLRDRVGGLSLAQWSQVQDQLKYTPSGRIRNFDAESFGVDFNEWADQELMSHGKDISFKDWAEDEGMKHGNTEITEWAQHEDESHDARYGAEDNTESIKSAIMKLEKALGKMDGATYKMHDLDISAQPTTIAGFEMSRNGEKYDGGSYLIMKDGSIINAAMGNAEYGNIADSFEEMNEKIMQSFGAESIVKKYGMIAAGVITAFALLPEIKKRF